MSLRDPATLPPRQLNLLLQVAEGNVFSMQKGRLVSLVVGVAWLVAAFAFDPQGGGSGNPRDRFALLGVTLVALALIWFGDELGEFTGFTGRGYITKTSPGWLVKLFGWVLLVGLIGVWIYHVAVRSNVPA
jgi:hypothetical protein